MSQSFVLDLLRPWYTWAFPANELRQTEYGSRVSYTMAPLSKRTKRSMDSLATAAAASPSAAAPPVSKRRVVKIADDADKVLAKCRKLRDELRKKHIAKSNEELPSSSSDDEWGLDDDSIGGKGKKKGGKMAEIDTKAGAGDGKKAKTQQMSLSELKSKTAAGEGKAIVEVVEMNSTQVMEGIENVAVKIAHQVLAKQGFQLDIPCKLLVCAFNCVLYVTPRPIFIYGPK